MLSPRKIPSQGRRYYFGGKKTIKCEEGGRERAVDLTGESWGYVVFDGITQAKGGKKIERRGPQRYRTLSGERLWGSRERP